MDNIMKISFVFGQSIQLFIFTKKLLSQFLLCGFQLANLGL